jgi:hypothetical protein
MQTHACTLDVQGHPPPAHVHAPQDLQYVLLQLWRAHCEACAEAENEAQARAAANIQDDGGKWAGRLHNGECCKQR